MWIICGSGPQIHLIPACDGLDYSSANIYSIHLLSSHCRSRIPTSPPHCCFAWPCDLLWLQRNISQCDAQRHTCACIVWLEAYAPGHKLHKKIMPQEASSLSLSLGKDTTCSIQYPTQSLELRSPANLHFKEELPSCTSFLWLL